MTRIFFGASAALTVALTGCAAKPPAIVPVEGVVLLDGAPLPKVKVLFFPQAPFDEAADYIAQGVTDDQGRFKLTCHGKDGACACENIVVVMDDVPEELSASSARTKYYEYMNSLKNRPVPEQLRSAATSPARVTITANQKEYQVELRR
jgi:hypothetical protein